MFQNWCLERGYERAAKLIDGNLEQMVTFYRLLRGHPRHLRIPNVVGSPFAGMRSRTDVAKLIQECSQRHRCGLKMLMVSERKFRRINSPELLPAVTASSSVTTAYRSKDSYAKEAAGSVYSPIGGTSSGVVRRSC